MRCSCDIVLCCADSAPTTERALRSVLEQDDAVTLVHLVDDGGGGQRLLERYGGSWKIRAHKNPVRQGVFASLQGLLPALRSEFVAIQDPRTLSRPERVARSVGLLRESGAEIVATGLEAFGTTILSEKPSGPYRRYVPGETLVFRRSTFADMGGFADRDGDEDVEFVYRASREGRFLLACPDVTVDAQDGWSPSRLGPTPEYRFHNGALRHHARGYATKHVECDVVLPFCGQFDYLEDALRSVLEQDNAHAVVHLIDDASPEGADDILRYWGTHRQVRTYRNLRNLGPFTSFNNVFPYFETDLVAIQDADDVSFPDRLQVSGMILELADADLFGAGMETMGSEEAAPGKVKASRIPKSGVNHFLVNSTCVMRRGAFEALGGFGDFGDTTRNRCGLDSELYLRARCAMARFAISKQSLLKYRVHAGQTTRGPETGWGTDARVWTMWECLRRKTLYESRPFDPRCFGGLRKYKHLTRRPHARVPATSQQQ